MEADGEKDIVEPCVVPGCDRPGKHKLGVRCRVSHEPSPIPGKSKTSALWAPDADAFLCDGHALGGAHITLIYEPNDSGETAVKVIGAPHTDDRRTPIRHELRGSDDADPSPDRPEASESLGRDSLPTETRPSTDPIAAEDDQASSRLPETANAHSNFTPIEPGSRTRG